jgi:hypothetical protein
MDRKDFEQFYEKTIVKIADGIMDQNNRINFSKDNFDGLFEEYLNQKTLLKLLLEKNDTNHKAEDNLLDRHKIAACITVAVMKMRLLHFNNNDDRNNNYSLTNSDRLNEQLAFLSGLHVIGFFMAEDPANNDKLVKFKFPKTSQENETSYLDSIIRTLYYSNTLSGFNTLLISNIFFLLEEYHKLYCTFENTKR